MTLQLQFCLFCSKLSFRTLSDFDLNEAIDTSMNLLHKFSIVAVISIPLLTDLASVFPLKLPIHHSFSFVCFDRKAKGLTYTTKNTTLFKLKTMA